MYQSRKLSEFDRIGASCVGGRRDVGELMAERGPERKGATGHEGAKEASASCCRGAWSGVRASPQLLNG